MEMSRVDSVGVSAGWGSGTNIGSLSGMFSRGKAIGAGEVDLESGSRGGIAMTLAGATGNASNVGNAQEEFAAVMNRARQVAGGKKLDREEQAKEAAKELVSISLLLPILKQVRESNKAASPFAPGPAEKQFGGIADAALARRLVNAQNWPLVSELAKRMTKAESIDAGKVASGVLK
jgi:hypothetical protein